MATIEIDGKTIDVEAGTMVIEAADDAGIVIPRFCYHKKLSVAANCRMCLVEVENGRKPMPACATPVTDGMKVFTKSKMALAAQKAVMEFLLVNHPLDCPICDQGGECELQDVSMGYGGDVSSYGEGKRSVVNDDLGSLIDTEMTRCIHCTRCVRFGEEIAGQREMGGTNRGEKTQIGTFVKHSITSEVSGNIIDLCPVGALTAKPSRYQARAWELSQHKQIASHDCLGSNTTVHVRRNQVLRVVPRENDQINETWLSDRDRFAYVGANAHDRLLAPMVKKDGVWQEVEWQEALNAVVAGFNRTIGKHGAEAMAGICSPSSTTEEAYLFQKLLRSINIHNIDHRIHQTDFADQASLPLAPISTATLDKLDQDDNIVLLGSNVKREQPLLGLRVRQASLSNAKVHAVNVVDYPVNFELANNIVSSPAHLVNELAAIVSQVIELSGQAVIDEAKDILKNVKVSEAATAIARALVDGESNSIIMGATAHNHPQAATIRSLVHLLERYTDCAVYRMTEGANEAGCHIAGVLPHRQAAGDVAEQQGLDVQAMIHGKLAGFLLHGIEAELDIAMPHKARQAMLAAEFVAVISSYKSDNMLEYADVLLPAAVPFETSGTFVNAMGDWQSFQGAVKCLGQARPAWKILRVLANLFEVDGFEQQSSEQVLEELKSLHRLATPPKSQWHKPTMDNSQNGKLCRIGEWPMYRQDSMCRHSQPLQESAANDVVAIYVHQDTANKYQLAEQATVSQGDIEITLPLVVDNRMPVDAVYVANAWPETSDLGLAYGPIELKK